MNKIQLRYFALGTVLSSALGFLTLPLISWTYSIEDVARYAVLQTAASFAVLVFSMGLDVAYVREYRVNNNQFGLLKQTFAPGFFLLILPGGLLLLVMPEMLSGALFELKDSGISWAAFAVMAATFVQRFLFLQFRLDEMGKSFTLLQLLPKALFMAGIFLADMLALHMGFRQLVFIYAAAMCTVTVVFLLQIRSRVIAAFRSRIDREVQWKLFRYGLPLIGVGLASWGINGLDRLLLRDLSNYQQLGLYSVAASFAGGVAIFSGLFNTIWTPVVYKWESEGADLAVVSEVADRVVLAACLLTSLAGIFSWLLVYLLPAQYAAIEFLVVPCIFFHLAYTVSEVTGVGVHLARGTKYLAVTYGIGLLVNIFLNVLLIPKFGAAAAAIAAAVSGWTLLVIRTEFSRRIWRPFPRGRMYWATGICLAASVGSTLTPMFSALSPQIGWAICLLVCAYMYRDLAMNPRRLISWPRH